MTKIELRFLNSKPNPGTHIYEMKLMEFEKSFLESLINLRGLPYLRSVDGGVALFLEGQYSYAQIRDEIDRQGWK